jgi:AcrR family transcriptional regulator
MRGRDRVSSAKTTPHKLIAGESSLHTSSGPEQVLSPDRQHPGAIRRSARQGEHVIEMQRRRLLTATFELVFERGVQACSIATVCGRAGVSRKTFYDIFGDREGCLLAAFEEAVAQATRTLERAMGREGSWKERIRSDLTGLLAFFDDEPAMGRLLVVEALGAGERPLQARRHVLTQIIGVVDQGRGETKTGRQPPPLTAEGVVGAVFSVIHARMLERDTRPLVGLAGALVAMIVQPYLGNASAEKELERASIPPRRSTPNLPSDPFKDLPIRLTYRTARVLGSIAAAPGSSSKQIALAAGIADEGQTSRLLTRLQNVELIDNTGGQPSKGEAKAWTLTSRGEGLLQALGEI